MGDDAGRHHPHAKREDEGWRAGIYLGTIRYMPEGNNQHDNDPRPLPFVPATGGVRRWLRDEAIRHWFWWAGRLVIHWMAVRTAILRWLSRTVASGHGFFLCSWLDGVQALTAWRHLKAMGVFTMGGRTDDDSPNRGSERAIASASRMAGKKAKPHAYTPKKKGHSGGDDEDR